MTAGLLDLTELAAQSGVPAPRLRQFAEAGLLPPARRDGDRLGYPPAEVSTARMLAGAVDLGLGTDTLAALAAGRREGECTSTQQRLADAVTARLELVQAEIADTEPAGRRGRSGHRCLGYGDRWQRVAGRGRGPAAGRIGRPDDRGA